MQTFLITKDFAQNARILDYRRLGKQRVECLQIIKCLKIGPSTYGKKTPYYFHPATQMWKGHERVLLEYMYYICEEWKRRGYKENCYTKAYDLIVDSELLKHNLDPEWMSDERLYSSHRSNLLRKDYNYYSRFNWTEDDTQPYFWPSKQNIS